MTCVALCSAFSEEDDAAAKESSDAFDVDSDFATPSTRSRKRSSMCERESFSELPGLPEDLSKPVPLLGLCLLDISPLAWRTGHRNVRDVRLADYLHVRAVLDGDDEQPGKPDDALSSET